MEKGVLLLTLIAGLVGIGSYIYAAARVSKAFRPRLVVALACNVIAMFQVYLGLGEHAETSLLFGLAFLAIGTIAISSSAVDSRRP